MGEEVELLDFQALRKRVNERLDSHAWWFILYGIGHDRVGELCEIVESRHYTPGKPENGGFEVVVTPYGLTIVMALKKFMNAEQFVDCLTEAGAEVPESLALSMEADSDILFPGHDEQEIIFAMRTLQEISGRE
jgi:hypothetical protein